MPQPTRSVTGTYTNPATQQPASGRLVFSTLPAVWTDAADGEILTGSGTVALVAGVLSHPLVTTDAAGVEPATGRYWVVEERIDGRPYRRRVFELPAGAPINLASIIDADPAQPGYTPVEGPPGPQGETGATGATGPAGPVATAWRRRDLPDPVLAESLYAGTPPVIGIAQTSTPSPGYLRWSPPGVALTGSDVTGPFSYRGATSFQNGTGTPGTTYVLPTSRYPNTRGALSSSQALWSLEFGTNAETFQVRVNHQTAAHYRLWVDGRRVTEQMQPLGGTTPGSTHLLTIELGSAAARVIRIDFATVPFGGIFLPPTATMWAVPSRGGRIMVLGDSLPGGSDMNAGSGQGTWFPRVAQLLGCNDAWNEALGSTGYITAGSTTTLGNRAATDVIAHNPTRLIIWAGYNDSAGDQGAIGTAASSLYAALKAGLPACEMYVIGCWAPTGSPGASLTNTDTTLRLQAAAAAIPFISPITGGCYDAAGALVATHGPFITAGLVAGYIGGDSVHPTDAGHVYLARRITAAIRELMPA
ncbi:SGNH/GDSL hydrolase family protein [Streptomyces sp. NPDC055254]